MGFNKQDWNFKIKSQSLFEFQTLSFWFQFEILTNRDREVLADEFKREKNVLLLSCNVIVNVFDFCNCEPAMFEHMRIFLKFYFVTIVTKLHYTLQSCTFIKHSAWL